MSALPPSLPPPLPMDYSWGPPPGPRRGMTAGQVLAWGAILLVVLIQLGGSFFGERALRRAATQPTTGPAADTQDPASNLQLRALARNAVGTKSLGARFEWAQKAMPLETFKPQLAKYAKSPADRLRLIPIFIELYGDPPATQTQQFLESNPPPGLARDAEALSVIYSNEAGALPPDERQRLIERHGWYAELALSHGKPDTDPLRQQVLRPAQRAFFANIILGLVVIGAVAAGLGLAGVGIVFYAKGKLAPRYRPDSDAPPWFLEGFAVYLVLYFGGSIAVYLILAGPPSIAHTPLVALPAVLIGALWPKFRGASWPELRQGLGCQRGDGFLKEAGCGIAGYLAGLPLIAAVTLLTFVLSSYLDQSPTHPIQDEVFTELRRVLTIYGIAALWAPLTEELLFRGSFFHHMRRRHGWWVSSLVVAVIFAAIHPQGWLLVPGLSVIALVMAAIREWRGTIVAPITAHAVHNGALVTMLLLTAG